MFGLLMLSLMGWCVIDKYEVKPVPVFLKGDLGEVIRVQPAALAEATYEHNEFLKRRSAK